MKRLATLPAVALMVAAFFGCSNKMEAKECDKLRGDAFELVNKAQHCNADADCRQSEWPGCAKPVSNSTWDTLKPMSDKYKQGQCEEPKVDCKQPPASYCKQGLCVHRELGTPQNAGAPAGEIQIK